MSEPIFDPAYWRTRLAKAYETERAWAAVFDLSHRAWDAMRDRHKAFLRTHIKRDDAVLDIGCGWGRLLGMMPEFWLRNVYHGVDLSPDMIDMAQRIYPEYPFTIHDIRDPIVLPRKFDVAVCIGIRHMILAHMSEAVWNQMLRNIRPHVRQVICMEEQSSGDTVL